MGFSCMTTAGIILITLSVLITKYPVADFEWMKKVIVTLNISGKLVVCIVWTMIFVYVGEIYPTLWRSTGSGLASGAGRIGTILAAQLALSSSTPNWVTGIIMGIIGITGGLAARLLPNTNGEPQPESFAAVHKIYGSRPLFSFFDFKL